MQTVYEKSPSHVNFPIPSDIYFGRLEYLLDGVNLKDKKVMILDGNSLDEATHLIQDFALELLDYLHPLPLEDVSAEMRELLTDISVLGKFLEITVDEILTSE